MAAGNYKETAVLGTQWIRAGRIIIENTLNAQPYVIFIKEKVINLEDSSIIQNAGSTLIYFNPTETIEILDPTTNIPTGEVISHYDLYKGLYSLFINTEIKNEAVNVQQDPVPDPIVDPPQETVDPPLEGV